MLNPVGVLRHVAVGGAVVAAPVLVMVGLIGGGSHDERFDAKQVVVTPVGDGVRIREVVDEDFGTNDRHGYERIIPDDFGAATDVSASSPDAPADLSVIDFSGRTRIRLGDPNQTIDGQHRYILTYTLPAAQLSTGTLALDIIGDPRKPEKFETGRFEVILAGFDLKGTTCNVGVAGTVGGCTLTRDGDLYRVVFEPLKAGEAVTVGGTIVSTTPTDVDSVAIPAPISHRSPSAPLAAGAAGLGALAGLGGFFVARRLGRNEVGGAGAADAAYGSGGGPTRLVSDGEMDSMVTTEFEPPRGIRPWQGAMLLTERIDTNTVSAWFSDQIALDYLQLTGDKPQVLSAGHRLAKADPATKQRINALLGMDGSLELGKYQPTMETLWKEVATEQKKIAAASGWWNTFAPGTSRHFPFALTALVGASIVIVGLSVWQGWLRLWPLALLAGFALPAAAAVVAYGPLLPQRSAAGSALALRAESFRRFLEASEGKHVDWAWQHGLLREYSAWAVALGAAEAWGRAVATSAVPPADVMSQTMPLVVYSHMGDWNTARTHPAPTNSGGSGGGFDGGGFSGGFSGGGGGGGSSGSW